MVNKPKVLIYGAFDRYNYGDNLMPILIENFLNKEFENFSDQFEFEFVSISESNLSKYGCKETKKIKDFFFDNSVSALIVAGGETMAAHIDGLYLNKFEKRSEFLTYYFLKKILRSNFKYISKNRYDFEWEYPYIPHKKFFADSTKIILNTVGGIPTEESLEEIKKFDHISVRDNRSFKSLENKLKVNLVPDSVLLISKLYPIDVLRNKVSSEVLEFLDKGEKHIVVQASPYLISCSANKLSEHLLKLKKDTGIDPILLPIGYASLHDDYMYLEKVYSSSNKKLKMLYDLSVWDIAYIIATSIGYYGTSLHGGITAMSYNVPHYCISKKVVKFTDFVKTWGIPCFQEAIHPLQIYNFVEKKYDSELMNEKINNAQNKIVENYHQIYQTICCN